MSEIIIEGYDVVNEPRDSLAAILRHAIAARPTTRMLDRRFSFHLYRLLAAGHPVRREELATALDIQSRVVDDLLDTWLPLIELDEYRRVRGFRGLTLEPTPHQFEISNAVLYTWCAWDAVFLPQILGATATVQSSCPQSGQQIALTITPTGLAHAEPSTPLLSFPLTSLDEMRNDLRSTFCQRIFFFASPSSATAWRERNDRTVLATYDEAEDLGRRRNAALFGDILSGEAS